MRAYAIFMATHQTNKDPDSRKSNGGTEGIVVGGEMRMKMAHADAASMTKCSEVKSRAKVITHDADWRAKIGRGHRIFERIRVRTDKVAKSA